MLPVAIITAIIGTNLTIHTTSLMADLGTPRALMTIIAAALLLATLLTTLTLTI